MPNTSSSSAAALGRTNDRPGGRGSIVRTKKLLSSLYSFIGEYHGGKEEKSPQCRRPGAAAAAAAGGGATRWSRFQRLRSSIDDRLRVARDAMEERSDPRRLLNPRDAIAADSNIREALRCAEGGWRELSELHGTEAKKRRSKFASEELDEMSRT
jgi:hypothetical protein